MSRAINAAVVLAFDDLGMNVFHEFDVSDFPVTVAVNSRGRTIRGVGVC